jgi:hypothetical protein
MPKLRAGEDRRVKMQYAVKDLEGALLDAAVAKADGTKSVKILRGKYCVVIRDRTKSAAFDAYEPSTEWHDGGPIIERERIAVWGDGNSGWVAMHPSRIIAFDPDIPPRYEPLCGLIEAQVDDGMYGDTLLVAAMRAFCASRFGETVELP